MIPSKKVRFENLYPIIEETVKKGNSFSFCAFGNSMLPFIRNGKDIVTLSPTENKLEKNDIIFYRRSNGQFVLHRIIKICSDGSLRLCGDNQYHVESNILKSQVIAKLTQLERDGKIIPLNSLAAQIWFFYLPFHRFFLHARSSTIIRWNRLFKK